MTGTQTKSYNKTAFVTGVTGQDGSYLVELLLDKGYRVIGAKRRTSTICTDRIDRLFDSQILFLNFMTLTTLLEHGN